MNINSQYLFDPPQPDNPTDTERYVLARFTLEEKGWPEDLNAILQLLSPPEPVTGLAQPGLFKGLKVGVIGGGLAGLSAAYELRKLGFEIRVFDALEDRVGGRVYTYYFNGQKDLYHEFGAMRIPVTHETVWHYLDLFKLPTRPFIQSNPNGYIYLKNTRVRNDRNGQSVMQYIYPYYAALTDYERTLSWQQLFYMGIDSHLLSATPEERMQIIQVLPQYGDKALAWSRNTSLRMIQAAGLSQGAINLIQNFHPVLAGNLYNSYIDYIQEDYPGSTTFEYEIPGGLCRLPLSFYRSLLSPAPYPELGGAYAGPASYLKGCWVEGIHYDGGGKVQLKYQRVKSRQRFTEDFDFVVCAIPFSTLRAIDIDPLFSGIKMRAIREVNYAPAQKSMMLCRERFWEKEGIFGGGSMTDQPVSSLWYPSDHTQYLNNPNGRSPDSLWKKPGVVLASYNFNLDSTRLYNQPEEKILEEIKKQIARVHGLSMNYMDSVVQGFKSVNWNQQPAFRGALCYFAPEQKEIFAYGMALPEYEGRVFFAGEHISGLHRWMQSALQTGMQAANDLTLSCLARS